MKKSTLLVVTAIMASLATLATVNLKLKSEYGKGNIKNPYAITKLKPFSYIKIMFDSTSRNGEDFKISTGKDAEYTIGTYYSERAKILSSIINDTLFITNDTLDKDHYTLFDAVLITAPGINGITANKGTYLINMDNAENFSVTAANETKVDLKLGKIKALTVNASNKASINVTAKDTINQASIQLNDKSSLDANHVIIRQKNLQLGDSVILHLRGRAIKDFGVQ